MHRPTVTLVCALVIISCWACRAGAGIPSPARLENSSHVGIRFEDAGVSMPIGLPAAKRASARFHWSTVAWGRACDLRPIGSRVISYSRNRVNYAGAGLVEWYRETAYGLEQGFDVATRIPGVGPLVIAGARPSTEVGVQVVSGGTELQIQDRRSGGALRCRCLVATDATGRILTSEFAVNDSFLEIVVDDSDAVYPIVIDPLYTAPQTTISNYGTYVSTVGDVNGDGFADVAVSDPYFTDGSYLNRGRVCVFLGGANGVATTPWWSTTGYGGGNPGQNWYVGDPTFGGDFNGDGYGDVCVGAGLLSLGNDWFEIYYGSPSGMTYGWTGLAPADDYGAAYPQELTSIANAGDLDRDGKDEIIGGNGNFENSGGYSIGAIFTWHTGGGDLKYPDSTIRGDTGNRIGTIVASTGDVFGDSWTDIVTTGPNGATLYDGFNGFLGWGWNYGGTYTTGLAGDVNGDGYADIVLGNATQTLVFAGSIDGPPGQPSWTLAAPATSLFTAGDIDGNGCADLLVANQSDGSQRGAVRVYQGYPSGGPQMVTTIQGDPGDYLGWATCTAGDVNGDGLSDVAIASWPLAGNTVKIFPAFNIAIYSGVGCQWATQGDPTSRVGFSVASSGDVNGDGYSDLVVGAPGDFGSNTGGFAFCCLGSSSGPSGSPGWYAWGGALGDSLGHSVACAGDVNGDGYSDVIVGAPGSSRGQTKEGIAYLYFGHPSGLSPAPDWSYESNDAGGLFGWGVASAGDVNGDGYGDVVIGEPNYTPSQDLVEVGRSMVFLGSANGLASQPAWQHSAGYDHAHTGRSVACAGDVNGDGYSDVIIGNPTDWIGRVEAGRSYVYYGSADGLSPEPGWGIEGGQDWEHFGSCVASVGDVNGDGYSDIAVGSEGYDRDSNPLPRRRLRIAHDARDPCWVCSAAVMSSTRTPSPAPSTPRTTLPTGSSRQRLAGTARGCSATASLRLERGHSGEG